MGRVVSGFWLLAVAGCSNSGSGLEVNITLPPAPGAERWFAVVSSTGLGDDLTTLHGLGPTRLSAERRDSCVYARVHSIPDVVDLDVRFCRTADCSTLDDGAPPTVSFELEHPFYQDEETRLTLGVERIPHCEETFECVLGVCREGRCGCRSDSECGDESYCSTERGICVRRIDSCLVAGCTSETGRDFFCDENGDHICSSPHESSVGLEPSACGR